VELYEMELAEAAKRLEASGEDGKEFAFRRTFCEPDPDGGGMFTVRYEVEISNTRTTKSVVVIGGIGLRWVDDFDAELKDGAFD
jgi:hypothetical protein